jgi:hypothetical protein
VSTNAFGCLSNQVLLAGLRCQLIGAFVVPEQVREMLEGTDVRDVRAVTVHQCPRERSAIVNYEVKIHFKDGLTKHGEFQAVGDCDDHETYVLYDRWRDGPMKHLHLLH